MSRRPVRAAATLVVTGLGVAYILWKIDVGRTVRLLADARLAWFFAALAIMVASVWPMAWRWQRLLAARGVRDGLGWLTRTYFVSYTAGQVLPTALGGDAARIYVTVRRHPGAGAGVAGTVLLERALGGTATLVLAAAGFALALGHYDVSGYLWVELAFVVATVMLFVAVFSRSARRWLRWLGPLLRPLRLERPVREVYLAVHAFRNDAGLLLGLFALTLGVQAVRVLAIWCCGKAVGVDLSPRPYYVMGPLLFLVMLVPFTINGLAVREAFFVSFLGTLGVPADPAFATGFLFLAVTIGLSLPGAFIVVWEAIRSRGGSTVAPRRAA